MNIMFVVIVITYLGCCVLHPVQSECVAPPMECPNENITFWIYTRENQEKGHQVMINDPESIKGGPWVPDAPIKILIHGYTGDKDFSPNREIRPAYMKCCDYTVMSVDYNPIAKEPCYIQAARNTELVGKCTAQLICELVSNYGFKLEQFHVIGFSLGGQIAGYIGSNLHCGKLGRITALDPAMPLFVTPDINKKVDKSDANFVDVLHTNALEKGKLEACGHVDFYANGGISQPGCRATAEHTKSSCDHARAPIYYAESIITDVGFYTTKCQTWITYMIGWCELLNSNEEVIFGEHVPWNATGTYFFRTNSEEPYAKGRSKKQKRTIPFFELDNF